MEIVLLLHRYEMLCCVARCRSKFDYTYFYPFQRVLIIFQSSDSFPCRSTTCSIPERANTIRMTSRKWNPNRSTIDFGAIVNCSSECIPTRSSCHRTTHNVRIIRFGSGNLDGVFVFAYLLLLFWQHFFLYFMHRLDAWVWSSNPNDWTVVHWKNMESQKHREIWIDWLVCKNSPTKLSQNEYGQRV